MKSLSDYIQDKQTALFDETGAFFAFSNAQFEAKRQPDTVYCGFDGGMVVPKANAKKLLDGLAAIVDEGIAQDLAENGREAIIRRELANYECDYTGDITDCVEALERYDISAEEINAIFMKRH